MTFIVRKSAPTGRDRPQYDFVLGAEDARVHEGGHLTLESSGPRKVVAVYAPGQWLTAVRESKVRQSDGNKVYDLLKEDNLTED